MQRQGPNIFRKKNIIFNIGNKMKQKEIERLKRIHMYQSRNVSASNETGNSDCVCPNARVLESPEPGVKRTSDTVSRGE